MKDVVDMGLVTIMKWWEKSFGNQIITMNA